MARDIPIGNGRILILYDGHGQIREFSYPYVGMENHAQGHAFRAGAWTKGSFSWFDDGSWEMLSSYDDETLVANIRCTNRQRGLEFILRDAVDFHEDLFVREILARNLTAAQLEARLFFHHDFHIYGTDVGDTACYKPDADGLLHYKGRRYFLVCAVDDKGFGISQFATGKKEGGSFRGTWADAEDGSLSGNPIAQGAVDSTLALHFALPPEGTAKSWYWIVASTGWSGAKETSHRVRERSPAHYLKRTADYWRLWLKKREQNFGDLPGSVVDLYKKSLLILRTAVNDNGAIIAAMDSDILQFNKDTYSYVWPRDGAIVAHALDLARYPVPAANFFRFCGEVMGREGYFLHKYNPQGSLASSWHPWISDGKPSLPIQEDETGLVIWALWAHFDIFRDIEFIKPLYRRLIKAAADFMCGFVDPRTGLPLPSYDLWEERLGVHTHTVCTVIAGLRAAARFVEAFGETDLAEKYAGCAQSMRQALTTHLFDDGENRFLRSLHSHPDGVLGRDNTLDASLFSVALYDVFPAGDERVSSTVHVLRERLWCRTQTGGMARYERDPYQAATDHSPDVPGNPWIVCTLWYAQYLIARAGEEDLREAVSLMEWVVRRALPSGVLPEQVHPLTGAPISVSPLTWSHAEFIITVRRYLDRLMDISRCSACSQPVLPGAP